MNVIIMIVTGIITVVAIAVFSMALYEVIKRGLEPIPDDIMDVNQIVIMQLFLVVPLLIFLLIGFIIYLL